VTAGEVSRPPPLGDGDIPLSILVDYDGTVALTDVSDTIMDEYVDAPWEELAGRYDAGLLGSRQLMSWEVSQIRAGPEQLLATAAAQPHDPAFPAFVLRARRAGIPVEVVSDGFGFFVQPALARMGLGDLPVATARTYFHRGRPKITFPNGHPACFVCGTCKRNRVMAHQATGRAVVFIGDGQSDRYAAAYSDIVFAKRSLIAICEREGWPHTPWRDFAELDAWLASTIAAASRDPAAIPAPAAWAPAARAPAARVPICGPEVWGPGRHDPPAPADMPPIASGGGER
jgi:2-hydroxy-3-keto-5-methylthiopentenyl-1-phosphate phosphatase